MSDIGLGLSYWLPQTQFAVDITKRNIVDTTDIGSWVRPVADVQIVPTAVEDPTSRQTLSIDVGLLEQISLTINLDDRRFIQSINGESGRDISPVMSLIGKAIGLASAFGMFTVEIERVPGESLEQQWAKRSPLLAASASALENRIESLFEAIGHSNADSKTIVEAGAALEVLQTQLANISQIKRAWIAAHAKTLETESWKLVPADLHRIPSADLPKELGLGDPDVPEALKDMVKRFGVLVAIVDHERGNIAAPVEQPLVDKIALRRSRPAIVGVYLRTPDDGWQLDKKSVQSMDIVDNFSETDYLSLEGSWLRSKKFELSYHPDMSLKSFGVTTTASASTVATSLGEVFDAVSNARKQLAERPTAAEDQLESSTTQLNLLKTASEYEVLAATRAKAVELAILEQQKKLREASS